MNLVNTCFLADSIIAYALGWMNELSGGVFLSCFAINDTRSLRNGEFTWALGWENQLHIQKHHHVCSRAAVGGFPSKADEWIDKICFMREGR